MGTLKVDEIRSTSAHDDANAITLSGNNATLTSNVVFPAGHLLQVKIASRAYGDGISHGSTNYIDINSIT